jgi:hypothetical protein
MCLIFTANYFFSGGRRLCRQRNALGDRLRESKPTQSFGDAYMGRIYVRVHISECSYVYEYLHFYCVSFKKSSVNI